MIKSLRHRHSPLTIFYGWWIMVAAFFTLGLAVGLPYFGMPFFYDYFTKPVAEGGFGWSRATVTLGLPLGTLVTLWVGPLLAHRFAPRRLILVGTGLTALTLIGFGRMTGNVAVYWGLWLVYMVGNVFSGVLTHQLLLAHWFVKYRGTALSVAYLGISLIGAFSARAVAQPLTAAYGFQHALQVMGLLLLLTWPVILWIMRDQPTDLGLAPDGARQSPAMPTEGQAAVQQSDLHEARAAPFRQILRQRVFWLLLLGGACSAGAIGSISQHLKLILKDSGFTDQTLLDDIFSRTLLLLLITSAVGRLLIGQLADRFPKRWVVTAVFLPLLLAFPLLYGVTPQRMPYLFALCFGLATGGDFLLAALMAGEQFNVATLGRVLAIMLPVMTVGQTWLPYLVAVLREQTGSYTLPLELALGLAVLGWGFLISLPKAKTIQIS
ncbi:MAG: MFS transporter [Caldilineaceae bacterium]